MYTDTAALRQTCGEVSTVKLGECENLFVEKVQTWLEEEDSPVALAVGYGLCGLTALYLLGCVIRGLLI